MKVSFVIEIDKIQSIDSIYLSQGEYSDILYQYINNGEYNLYFLTYVDKYRFDLNQCRIENNQLQIKFTSHSDLIETGVQIRAIDQEHSTSRHLRVTTNQGPSGITINEALTNWGKSINRIQEIQYIGQSKNIGNRLNNHEKLIQAFAAVPDEKEVLINFVRPSFSYANITTNNLIHFNKGTIENTNFQHFNYQLLIDLTERILVKYYQPKLNINFINTDLSTDRTIQEIRQIAQNEIFIISNSTEGIGYNFMSESQMLNTKTFLINNDGQFQDYEE